MANRHSCCVCQKSGVQIHHIDDNPSNNDIENLAALCPNHHDMATMTAGLTKKIKPDQVRGYKEQWENKCKDDILALARDRVNYYATLYKNPPRIREASIKIPEAQRKKAVEVIGQRIIEENGQKSDDAGFDFQLLPKQDQRTGLCLASAMKGELWPKWHPKVTGHPKDPYLPHDMSPPHGLQAYHNYDLYCQIMVQVLSVVSPPILFEDLFQLDDLEQINSYAGRLIVFRERAIGKDIKPPGSGNYY